MIIGVGTDIVDMRRIGRVLDRHGDRFSSRIFTQKERAICEERGGRHRVESYARRWAAKEACAKALGVGLVGGVGLSVAWIEIEIARGRTGRPHLMLHGTAADSARSSVKMAASDYGIVEAKPRIHVSMTDDPPYAQACVVFEAVLGVTAVEHNQSQPT
jgi:holo-[acyl-carrier protein] synthase